MSQFPPQKARSHAIQEVAQLFINKNVYASIGENKTVLSIGCNTGMLESLLQKRGNAVYGIDNNSEAIKIAKQRLHHTSLLDITTAKKLPFSKDFFDVIILADVLEHVADPPAILALIKPYLKQNSYIVASIPNVANWTIRFQLLFGNFRYTNGGLLDKTHLRFFTLQSARNLFLAAGYEIHTTLYNTSIVNFLYDFFKKNADSSNPKKNDSSELILQSSFPARKNHKNIFRRSMKYILEQTDETITLLFPGLFANQFIFIAMKRQKKE